ncbi:MAG TPA: hypothetical protein VES19_08560 [Candidatus Limnocylindrales bacterium]|nr:hypothetical protein [Candidatus Limnocylindrales bacterium]
MNGRDIARALAALLLSILAATTGVHPVAAAIPDPFMGGAFPQGAVLEYRWVSGAVPPAAIKTAINAAADDATASRRSKAPTFDYATDATNGIGYGLSAPCGVNGLACFRRDAPVSFAIYLREHGHRFDWGVLRWCEIDRVNGCYDAENITLDELGHVLGLDHHDNLPDDSDYGDAVVQQYSRARPREFYNAHVFGRCDYATLQQVYDVLTFSTLYSTCLDVPTALSISASRSSVVAGSVVTFTATLGSNGSGRLSNNPVSGRIVVLQQRTSGSWVDVFTMVPGSSSGTYGVGMTMRATGDLRAVFRKPGNEGLRGSWSAPVTVTVSAACTTSLCPQSVPGPTR